MKNSVSPCLCGGKNIPETIRETIKCRNLIPDGAKVVVGVSGGADSVALLRAVHQLKIPCTVAHLNHQLRGAESDADERFVRELASELGLTIVVKSADVRGLAETSGLSIEMAARQARHDFFAEFEDSIIALAHHADDQ
ncbi:MAG: ATP-binding protein, partial [Verrucomicrobiota bacterium]